MSDDQVIRTSGTLPVAQHLRPKPRQHPHWYLRYIRRGPPEPGHGDWQCGFSTTTTRSSGPSGARHEHRTGGLGRFRHRPAVGGVAERNAQRQDNEGALLLSDATSRSRRRLNLATP